MIHACRHLLPLAILCLLLSACSATLPPQAPFASRSYQLDLGEDAQGWSRSALVHLPPGLDTAPRPLLLVFHGAFSTGEAMERETGFSTLADREGFIVAYPQGIGLFGLLQHWNAGFCCGRAEADDWDDVGTVLKLLEVLDRRLPVDRSRVYLAGMSNGGMLVYRLAAEHPELFAAAAVMSGTIGSSEAGVSRWTLPAPDRPVPMLILHGRADRNVPYAGGVSPLKGGERAYATVEDAVAFWRRADGCSEVQQQSGTPETVAETRWSDCREGSTVVRIAIPGWGHVWPGPAATALLPADAPLHGFDAASRCWQFLRTYRRPDLRFEP